VRDRLVLWDVDGTLIPPLGLRDLLYCEAFKATAGREPTRLLGSFAGVELADAAAMLELNGLRPSAERLERFREQLEAAIDRHRERLARAGPAAGVERLLAALAEGGTVQTLVTGNVRRVAEVKVATVGLDRHLDLEVGAYGWDAAERWRLVALARERAGRKHGRVYASANTVVIGDTPLDVEAAQRGGAAAIAVATGPVGLAELEASGADVVLPHLADVEGVLAAVERLTGEVP
jgi:phosphoglycolate phosphatase